MYERTTDLKKINPELKVLVAVGGWNMGSTDFSNMVANSASRARFISTTIEFLRERNLDGLDLDWEYPSNRAGSRPEDKERFACLCKVRINAIDSDSATYALCVRKTDMTSRKYEQF